MQFRMTKPETYGESREWSDKMLPDAMASLMDMIGHVMVGRIGTHEEDMCFNTDAVFALPPHLHGVPMHSISFRYRRAESAGGHRDLTIRTRRASGVPTELQKLLGGHGTLMLIGWTLNDRPIEQVLIDLVMLRQSGLLACELKETPNQDGLSWFTAIPVADLKKIPGVVVAHRRIDTWNRWQWI